MWVFKAETWLGAKQPSEHQVEDSTGLEAAALGPAGFESWLPCSFLGTQTLAQLLNLPTCQQGITVPLSSDWED